MEIKFEGVPVRHLQPVVWEEKRQEQTQEVRLPEDQPDAARILGCWGQCLLRGKEWRGSGLSASGGCTVWVLYAPEDGTQPRSMEVWVPFQCRWDLPDADREGTLSIRCRVRAADARVVSARRLLVRLSLCLEAIALVPGETAVYRPSQVPEEIHLLESAYPMELPVEAGEKQLLLEEETELPGAAAGDRLARCCMTCEVTERRMIGDRMVYRGTACLDALICRQEGPPAAARVQLPISQYVDLDREHPDADAQLMLTPTALEAVITPEGKLSVKASVAAQYILWERVLISVTEDAYSLQREVTPVMQPLGLPARLEEREDILSCQCLLRGDAAQVVDAVCGVDVPEVSWDEGSAAVRLPGQFQVLYLDTQGQLRGDTVSCVWEMKLDTGADTALLLRGPAAEEVRAEVTGEGIRLEGRLRLPISCVSRHEMQTVQGLELGELRQPDPSRPSLILCRTAGESLWSMAKASGSTVARIRAANGLEGEPERGRLLLIPVE